MDSPTQEIVSNTESQTPVTPVVSGKRGGNKLLVEGLFILVFILLLAVGFLGYQNIQLRKQIAAISNVSISPTPSATPDVTVNWKTYQHTSCGNYPSPMPFSVKIPAGWTEAVSGGSDKSFSEYSYQNKDTSVKITCGTGFGGGGCGLLYPSIQNSITVNGGQISACMEQNSSNNTITLRLAYLSFPNITSGFSLEASAANTTDNKNLINQILSTFVYSGQ